MLDDVAAAAEAAPEPGADPLVRPPRRAATLGCGFTAAGAILLWVVSALSGSPGLVRLVVLLVAIALIWRGLRLIGLAVFGSDFDLGFALSCLWLVGLCLAAALADVLPLGNADDTSATIGVVGYSRPDLFSAHPLGTNSFGLDLLARSIYGARVSLLTVALAVTLSLVIGGFVGLLAGYFGRWVDATIGVVADASIVIPALVLLIAFAAVLGPPESVGGAVIKTGLALAIVGVPTMIRLARANSMVFAQREFVTASRAMGARHSRVMLREILPNIAPPLLSYAFVIAAVLIVAEGSLAYIGLGLQQPSPSWGNMIAEGGLRTLREHTFVPIVPGAFMFLTVMSLNVVGERCRVRWDRREAKL